MASPLRGMSPSRSSTGGRLAASSLHATMSGPSRRGEASSLVVDDLLHGMHEWRNIQVAPASLSLHTSGLRTFPNKTILFIGPPTGQQSRKTHTAEVPIPRPRSAKTLENGEQDVIRNTFKALPKP
jgi:hypothetical protein